MVVAIVKILLHNSMWCSFLTLICHPDMPFGYADMPNISEISFTTSQCSIRWLYTCISQTCQSPGVVFDGDYNMSACKEKL